MEHKTKLNCSPAKRQAAVQQLGETLRGYRLKRRMTQVELAKRAGCTRVTVGLIELGKHVPYMKTVGAFGLALDIDPDDLIPKGAERLLWDHRPKAPGSNR